MKRFPTVAVNFAVTWDGKISTRNFTPADFSSKRDKHRLLEIRATGDALLVGANTISSDNMSMGLPDAALRAQRVRRKQTPWPLRVIITNSGRIDPALNIFQKRFFAGHRDLLDHANAGKRTQSALAGKADATFAGRQTRRFEKNAARICARITA